MERSSLKVTLLGTEWRSAIDGDLSTLNRELAIQLAKNPSVQVSVFVPQCSEDDKRIAASHKVQLMEAEKVIGVDPVLWLINIPQNHALDCIIGHGVHLGGQIQCIQRSGKTCKWIHIVHTAPRDEKLQQTITELCELADQVVAVGPKLKDTCGRFLCCSTKHQDIIDLTPSIFTEFKDVKQTTKERQFSFFVLVVGSGDSENFNMKGYDLAAEAIAQLEDKSYKLNFVCATREKEDEIKEKLLKHGIDRSQIIVRSFNESRETLARLFCMVDLAIMPSRSEGFGLKALEALSAGLPVLVSSNSGLGEVLRTVPNGSNCVVDSEDPKDWATAIKKVRGKGRGVRLEESGYLRKEYLRKYSWQEPCDFLVQKMQNLVTGKVSYFIKFCQFLIF